MSTSGTTLDFSDIIAEISEHKDAVSDLYKIVSDLNLSMFGHRNLETNWYELAGALRQLFVTAHGFDLAPSTLRAIFLATGHLGNGGS